MASHRPRGIKALRTLAQSFMVTESSEWQQAVIRAVIVSAVVFYLSAARLFVGGSVETNTALLLTLAYLLASLCNLASFRWFPASSNLRRTSMMVGDLAVTTYAAYLGGETVTPFSAVYLWIIVGHGIRYGEKYLLSATILGGVGFGLVLFFTPYWQVNVLSGLGLLFTLLIIPVFVHTLIRRLRIAKEAAETASVAKSIFAADLSHEIRTGLASIAGLSELVCRSKLQPSVARHVALMNSASRTLLSLADDVLDLSSLENGNFRLRAESVDLYRLVLRVTDTVRPMAREKKLPLQLTVRTNAPPTIVSDERRITQILLNLLTNAVKYTSLGFVEVELSATAYAFRLRIKDTGSGMPVGSEMLDRYTQVDSGAEGEGLGLSIVSSLTEQLGGTLCFGSPEGKGTEFVVELPRIDSGPRENRESVRVLCLGKMPVELPSGILAESIGGQPVNSSISDVQPMAVLVDEWDYSDRKILSKATMLGGGLSVPILVRASIYTSLELTPVDGIVGVYSDLKRGASGLVSLVNAAWTSQQIVSSEQRGGVGPLRILVAEDEPVSQLYMRTVLEELGCCVTVVGDGPAAVQEGVAGDWDLAFIDNQLPGFKGEVVLKRLNVRTYPKVILSANALDETIERAIRAGANRYLVKPASRTELEGVLRELVPRANTPLGNNSDAE